MVGEETEKKLYDAATKGDLARFKQVVKEDPYLLDVVSFACPRNLLHTAIAHGHVSIVEEMLKINPQLARDLDAKNSSSLHITAAQGSLEIATKLLQIAPEMCWWRNCHDMNPIHVAAMKGNEEVLKELLQQDSFPAMERLHRGQTVLHLCVKHRQLETLKVLVEKLGELVYAKDDDGETVLHLAVRCNQIEMIRYLVGNKKIEKLTKNSMDKTALDLLNESPTDTTTYADIKDILNLLLSQSIGEAFPKLTDITMVVVVLIATMAFQATVSPPGGVWQDDTSSHRAGEAVMASTHPKLYKHFSRANTTAFVSSLMTIFLITTEGPLQNIFFVAIASYAMWAALASIGVSYGASLIMTNPMETQPIGHIVAIVVSVPLSIIVLLVLYNSAKEWCLSLKRLHPNLATAPSISRYFYLFFVVLFECREAELGGRTPILDRSGSPSQAA